MVALKAILFGLSTFAFVSCHFTLDSPTTRGFSDDEEPTAPCGGRSNHNYCKLFI